MSTPQPAYPQHGPPPKRMDPLLKHTLIWGSPAAGIGVIVALVMAPETTGITLGVIVIIALNLCPGIVGSSRGLPAGQQVAIWLITLFLGWTIIGWIGALIWALAGASEAQRQQRMHDQARMMAMYTRPPPPPPMR